jgi:SAM-dependent methyltransferase
MLDETATAGSEHLDPAYVGGYDRKAGFDPTEDLETLRDRGLGPDSTLIDLGCGTGELVLAASEIAARVVAVDISKPMLDALRAKAEARGRTNIDTVNAGFLSYEHRGSQADFIYTRNALHHLPDFWKAIALTRIAGMLRSGGVLLLRDLIYAFDPAEAAAKLEDWFASASRSPDIGWTSEELQIHVRTEHSTFSWLLEPMLAKAGLAVNSVQCSDSRVYVAYLCAKQ